MSQRVVFFVNRANFEAAYQASTLGITARAMGDEVIFVFAFDALRALVADTFGEAANGLEEEETARAMRMGLPSPAQMLAEARELGAKLVVCDTTLKMCALTAEQVNGRVDEVLGLASIWRLTQGARTLTF